MHQCSNSYLIAQVATWVIVVVGWFVVHLLSVKRDERKETRDCLNQLIVFLREIEGKAVEFHRAEVYKEDLARVILFDIQRIIYKFKRYPFRAFDVSLELQKDFRRSITLKNFDPTQFTAQPANSLIICKIANVIDDLEDQLEKEYEKCYL